MSGDSAGPHVLPVCHYELTAHIGRFSGLLARIKWCKMSRSVVLPDAGGARISPGLVGRARHAIPPSSPSYQSMGYARSGERAGGSKCH